MVRRITLNSSGSAVVTGGTHSLLVPDRFERLRCHFHMTIRENRASRCRDGLGHVQRTVLHSVERYRGQPESAVSVKNLFDAVEWVLRRTLFCSTAEQRSRRLVHFADSNRT